MALETTETKMPRLANEVWVNIFEWATFVPNAFDTNAPDLFAYPAPWSQDQIQEGILGSLCTKRRIVLTCKLWNALATRLLYRSVSLVRPWSLCKLLRTLRRDSESTPNGLGTKAHWILRLDIVMKRKGPLLADDLLELLHRLPNLRIIVMRGYLYSSFLSDEDVSLFSILEKQPVQSLNVLDVRPGDYDLSRGSFFIKDMALRVLRIRPSNLMHVSSQELTLLGCLESLNGPQEFTSLSLNNQIPDTSFSHITLHDNGHAFWSRFWSSSRASGAKFRVTVLEIHQCCLTMAVDDALFDNVAECCPNLNSIVFNLKRIESLSIINYFPPVRKLGFRFYSVNCYSKKWLKQLCEVLVRLIILMPSLEVIRIIDKPTFVNFKNNHARSFKAVGRFSIKFLSDHGVRFEDCKGRLFHEGQVVPGAKKPLGPPLTPRITALGATEVSV